MPDYLHVSSWPPSPREVWRHFQCYDDARRAAIHWIKHGFDFCAQSANGWVEWHAYPTRCSIRLTLASIRQLFDDIVERGHPIPDRFDINMHGDDDGCFEVSCYDWNTRDEFGVCIDPEGPYSHRCYHVPKSEQNKLGFKIDTIDKPISNGMVSLIDEYEWLLKRQEVSNEQ